MERVKCKRCGEEWIPRLNPPKICKKCKSKYWNKNKIEREYGCKTLFFNKRYGRFIIFIGSAEFLSENGIIGQEGFSQKKLEKWLKLSQSTVSKSLNTLKKTGLIYKNKKRLYNLEEISLFNEFFGRIKKEVLSNLDKDLKNYQKEKDEEILYFKDYPRANQGLIKKYRNLAKTINKKIKQIEKLKLKEPEIKYLCWLLISLLIQLSFDLKEKISLKDIQNIFAYHILEGMDFNDVSSFDRFPKGRKNKNFEIIKILIREYKRVYGFKPYINLGKK